MARQNRFQQIYNVLKDEPFLTAGEIGYKLGCSAEAVGSGLTTNYKITLTQLRKEVIQKHWRRKDDTQEITA